MAYKLYKRKRYWFYWDILVTLSLHLYTFYAHKAVRGVILVKQKQKNGGKTLMENEDKPSGKVGRPAGHP